MSIREREQALFNKWRQGRKAFVEDGVVSEHYYEASNPKIALILKEVNDPDGGDWDLRQFLANGGQGQTWNNAARWIHGIRHRSSAPGWQKHYENVDADFRREELRSLCVINLKKDPGDASSDMNEIRKLARKDRKYILRQYAIYDPDLTICGGTGDIFSEEILTLEPPRWRRTRRGIWWYEREKSKYIIYYFHPGARVFSPFMHYGLVDAVSEMLR